MLGPLTVIVWLALLVSPCVGISYQFVSTTGNNPWELPANWQPNGIPTSADDVIIPYTPSGFYSVSINSQATCKSLLIGGPSGPTLGAWDPGNTQTLSIVSGTLSIATNATVLQSGVIEVIGAGLTGLSTEGMVMVKGGFVFGNGGTHTITTIGIVILSGGYLSIAAEPSGVILSNGAHIVVEPQGNMTLMSNYGVNTDDTTAVYVANYGNLYIAPASLNDFSTKLSVPFMNFGTGTVYVTSGEVAFSVNSTWDGTLSVMTSSVNFTGGFHQFLGDSTILGSGALQIQNEASITLQGPVTISNFVLALGLVTINNQQITTQFANFLMLNGYLSGTPTAIQQFTWAGGFISVSDLAVNVLQIQGAFTASMTETALIVAQQASFEDTTHLLLYNSSFTLQEGAHMEFADEIFLICGKNDTISVIQIGGTLEISFSSAPITLTCNLVIMSTGVIHTTAGLLDIQTPVTSSGTINIDSNSSVILETTSTFFVGSSLTGAGVLNCQSCTALISGTIDIGTLQFPAGTITVSVESGLTDYVANVMLYNQSGSSSLMLINDSPANLNFTIVNMIFAGGNITSNRNAQLNLQANLIITNSSTFTGLQPYLFTNVAYVNYGYTSFYGNGALKLWEDTLFYNAPSGVISVPGGLLDVSQNDHVGYVSELRNEGKFVVELGATAQLALTLRNLGEVDVRGQLAIAYGFYIQENDAVIDISTYGSVALSNPGLFLGGTITGTGMIQGTVTLAGATMGVNDNTNLTMSILLVRGNGTLEVDVASTSMLKIQSLCQVSGGNLLLYSSDTSSPASKQYVSAPSIIGSGFNDLLDASLNSTDGLSITNTSAGLFAFPVPRPNITSITPQQGVAGTTIVLTGTNFMIGDSALNISVLFQGVAVPTYIVNRVSVNATVPALTGDVTVTILSDGRISIPLIWSFEAPQIQSIDPQSGPTIAANLVTITGANFGEDTSQVEVVFGSFGTCSISELTNSQIVCAVPPGIGANVTVTVQASAQKTAPTYYTYYPPTISSVYPSVLEVVNGSNSVATITVTGDNLATGEVGGNISILVGQHACLNVTQVSLTTFTCSLPSSLTTGQNAHFPITVDVAGQRSSSLSFYVFYDAPTPESTNHWWPFPWWIFLIMGGALVVFLLLGVLVGCKTAKRGAGGGYEPISTDPKRQYIN